MVRHAGRIAVEAAAAGGTVEVVGSVGDDDRGDALVVELGRAGVGHAALLRDPAGGTPGDERGDLPLPRLDARDVELGLGYLTDYRVLVLAEPLAPDVERAALDAAAFHGAEVIALVEPGSEPTERLGTGATVLEAPAEDAPRFAAFVGRLAAELDRGVPGPQALRRALSATGWEAAGA